MLAELKQCFLEAYDDNRDGKIDIREVWYIYISLFISASELLKIQLLNTLVYQIIV